MKYITRNNNLMSLCTITRYYSHKVRVYSLLPGIRKTLNVFKTEDNVCVCVCP